jgi:dimeric dUTPase (all-alpha-NTP-PPase superfamily)
MNCREIMKHISDYIDKEMEETLKEVFEQHIRICKRCRINLDSIEKTLLISKFIYKEEKIPKNVKKTLYYRIKMRYKR